MLLWIGIKLLAPEDEDEHAEDDDQRRVRDPERDVHPVCAAGDEEDDEEREQRGAGGGPPGHVARAVEQVVDAVVAGDPTLDRRPEVEEGEDERQEGEERVGAQLAPVDDHLPREGGERAGEARRAQGGEPGGVHDGQAGQHGRQEDGEPAQRLDGEPRLAQRPGEQVPARRRGLGTGDVVDDAGRRRLEQHARRGDLVLPEGEAEGEAKGSELARSTSRRIMSLPQSAAS